jgi:polyhydroxyalkanoate synthesis regulator phasin
MADSRPLWRQGYDAVESSVGPQLEQLVASEQFSQALGVLSQLRREFEQRASRTTRHLLHRFNLPAGSDMTRLLNEIGELKKQVRKLSEQLEERDGA